MIARLIPETSLRNVYQYVKLAKFILYSGKKKIYLQEESPDNGIFLMLIGGDHQE